MKHTLENSLLVTTEQQVCTLTLNRPNVHNAFDDQLILNMITALKAIQNDQSIRAVILKSNGRHFSAGADLNWMQQMINYSEIKNKKDSLKLAELMQILNQLNVPTIALVQGAAYGGAVGLVACCDIALATKNAVFCFSEVKIGLIPAVISPYVIQAIGARAARRYFLTAENFDAKTALSLGLIHQLVENLDESANMLIKTIKKNSPKAICASKQIIFKNQNSLYNQELIDHTASQIAKIRVSTEGQEGIKSFLEKRKPYWIDAD